MLRDILNKSWKQHPTKQQQCGNQHPITKTIQIRRARHAGHCRRSKDKLTSDVSYGPLHMDEPVLTDQQELIYTNSVRTQDAFEKTCRKRLMTGTNVKSVGKARTRSVTWLWWYIYIYIYTFKKNQNLLTLVLWIYFHSAKSIDRNTPPI